MALIICCCLCVEEPALSPEMLKQLAQIGIQHTFIDPFRKTADPSDLIRKGKAFQKRIGPFPIRPSQEVFIDRESATPPE